MKNIPIDIIHTATAVDTANYVYTQIYASAETTLLINGVSVIVPVGVLIPINIKSIGSSVAVFCLGTKITSFTADPLLG